MKRILSILTLSAASVASSLSAQTQTQTQDSKITEGALWSSQQDIYTHPGILFKKDQMWTGTDYLYNVPRQIGVVVEIIAPELQNIKVNPIELTSRVADLLRGYGIDARLGIPSGPEGLPYFNLLIMIYPVKEGTVALVDGRLFEIINTPRVNLAKDTALQAITWEKKTLIRASREEFSDFLVNSIIDITSSFGERFKTYVRLKEEAER